MQQQIRYLYGAAVQGIQSFIFQTNELKDIIGASELVENICTECFKPFEPKLGGEMIVTAAGNIKCIFDNEEECRKAVLNFPRAVMTYAPGITISEAVVKFEDGKFSDAVNNLEHKLRAQRNRPFPSITTGLMGIERSRTTGLPAVKKISDDYIDKGTLLKRKNNEWSKIKEGTSTTHKLFRKCFGIEEIDKDSFALYVEKMATDNNWLAVIHADGNSLGEIISNIGSNHALLKEFSAGLDVATTQAARKASSEIIGNKEKAIKNGILPIRPIVLSGDDFTVICRASIAVDYTQSFLHYFEEETEKLIDNLKKRGLILNEMRNLTACAGIAFIKSSYPFHYGYSLAENLCERAKRDSKSSKITQAPSCIMFHKVQSSFVENYEIIAKKELNPYSGHSFEFGPYYLYTKENYWTIDQLKTVVKRLKGKEGNTAKSDIRQWITLMYDNPDKAYQKALRVIDVTTKKNKETFIQATTPYKRNLNNIYPAYDILTIHSINMPIETRQ